MGTKRVASVFNATLSKYFTYFFKFPESLSDYSFYTIFVDKRNYTEEYDTGDTKPQSDPLTACRTIIGNC